MSSTHVPEDSHIGDPCPKCGTPHDEVERGPCMGAPSARRFRRLVGSFKNVPGAWAGTSYGYHPHGVIRRGIIFTDHHNVNDYCSASVILDPTAKISSPAEGRDASCCGPRDRATPHPERGGILTIYRNGRWEGEDGPWRQLVIDTLAELVVEIAEIEANESLAREAAASQFKAERAAKFDQARAAIAKVTSTCATIPTEDEMASMPSGLR